MYGEFSAIVRLTNIMNSVCLFNFYLFIFLKCSNSFETVIVLFSLQIEKKKVQKTSTHK